MYKELFKKAKDNNLENFQILEISTEELDIKIFNDQIDKFETSDITKYIVSANYNNKDVRIVTEKIDNNIIDLLKEQAEYIDLDTPVRKITLEDIKENKTFKINDPSKIIERMLNLITLKKQYKNLKEINSYYTESITKRTIITSKNELYDIKKEISFSSEITVSENEKNSTSYKTKIITDDSDINIEKITKETINNATDKLHYKEITNGTYKVILTSEVMGSILRHFINLFSADSIQKDTSLLVDKLGKKVFSDKITIVEDPNNSKLLGKRLFDNTGKKTSYKEIVKNGIFTKALYDSKTAKIDKVEVTGNDYGEISVRNMYIKPGNKSLDELIKSIDKGILVDFVGGLHAGINPINGNISIQSEGYYIENGQKKYATKLFILVTNIMELLNNVIDISNNIEFYYQDTASPDLLLDSIKISK